MIQYVKSSIFSAEGQHMNDIMAIGIAGGTGSGKTTITRLLSERFGKDVSVIYYDNYYKAHDDLTYDERAKINYDCPDAFDTELFLEDVAKLKRGEDVLCPVYDYTVHNRSNQTLLIKSAPVILLEGILLLSDERIRDLLDIKIFVDTDADVRILRRIMRDVKERKRSLESVVEQYLTTVKPMHEMYVEPSKRYANIIIPEGGHNMVAVNMLMERINAHINA
jgi:uridine kinase